MLSRVLLHVVTAALRVNQAVDPGSLLNSVLSSLGCILQDVQNRAIFSFGHLRHAQFVVLVIFSVEENPSRVKQLAAARRIKGGSIENQRWTRVGV
jgi:hypothetical protein